jgi:IS1 family transposase
MVSMNRLSADKRAQVIASLVEGNSIRATVRMTGVAKNTVTKLLVDMGTVCSVHQDRGMRDLTCKRIQCDEIWAFVGSKEKNVPLDKRGEWGDVWTWVALDADTKLVPTYRVGGRDAQEAQLFMQDIASRLSHRVQLTTDGHRPYPHCGGERLQGRRGLRAADQDLRLEQRPALLARAVHRH